MMYLVTDEDSDSTSVSSTDFQKIKILGEGGKYTSFDSSAHIRCIYICLQNTDHISECLRVDGQNSSSSRSRNSSTNNSSGGSALSR
jgi:hypothetical protein